MHDPSQAAALEKDLDEAYTEYAARRAYWHDAPLPGELRAPVAQTIKTADAFWAVVEQQYLPALKAGDLAQLEALHRDTISPLYHQQHTDITTLVAANKAYAARSASQARMMVGWCLALITALALALLGALAWSGGQVQRQIVDPLSTTTEAIRHLADGDFASPIAETGREDELGVMARAMEVFRQAGIARQRAQAEQAHVVGQLSHALDQLAEQNLEWRISDEFPVEYAKLRQDFNRAVDALARALGTVRVGAAGVMSSISEIRMASDDLARRNEQQAASLEETAAAMSQVTSGLSQTAQHAASVQQTVQTAHVTASEGGAVVQRAITAMTAIETSSREISQIINVIDGIAFQTNLLALNAGVEAARAGDSGKGFAVVANEVRALAQRSAEAAQNIKTLINTSATQVGEGVTLVGETGAQLTTIVTQVAEMATLAAQIAKATDEQANSLQHVNSAIHDMDMMTQQNAAMVEQSSAATHALESEATSLTALVSTFRTRDRSARERTSAGQRRKTSQDGGAPIQFQGQARPAQPTLAHASPPRPAPHAVSRGNLALAAAPAQSHDDWAEF